MILNKMKIGQLLTGLAIVAIAFGANAFTESVTESKMQTSQIWVNETTSGDYSSLASPNDYNSTDCENLSSHTCAFQRTEKPGTVPNEFTAEEAAQLLNDELIEPVDNNTGIYSS